MTCPWMVEHQIASLAQKKSGNLGRCYATKKSVMFIGLPYVQNTASGRSIRVEISKMLNLAKKGGEGKRQAYFLYNPHKVFSNRYSKQKTNHGDDKEEKLAKSQECLNCQASFILVRVTSHPMGLKWVSEYLLLCSWAKGPRRDKPSLLSWSSTKVELYIGSSFLLVMCKVCLRREDTCIPNSKRDFGLGWKDKKLCSNRNVGGISRGKCPKGTSLYGSKQTSGKQEKQQR